MFSRPDTTVRQVRTIRYHQIAEDLKKRLKSNEFAAGKVLPSEASLGAHYDASRVTVRKSLELLRGEGLVDSRQGFGWFAAAELVAQPLTGLSTIEGQLAESGRQSERRILDFQFVEPPDWVKPALGQRVLEVRRINMADGEPFARVTVWCREDLGATLSKSDVERASFYSLLDVPIRGASQTIGAQVVGPTDADILGVPQASAVLVVRRTTHSAVDEPILVSEHVFPGHLTEFVAELPTGLDEMAPAGVRLVTETED